MLVGKSDRKVDKIYQAARLCLFLHQFLVYADDVNILGGSVGKGKGKAVPLQAWTGPEGSRKLRFPDFVTTAQNGGKDVSLKHRPLIPPGNTPGTRIC